MEKAEYTEQDMLHFAAYRSKYADQTSDDYKNILESFYDWKVERKIVKCCYTCQNGSRKACHIEKWLVCMHSDRGLDEEIIKMQPELKNELSRAESYWKQKPTNI